MDYYLCPVGRSLDTHLSVSKKRRCKSVLSRSLLLYITGSMIVIDEYWKIIVIAC